MVVFVCGALMKEEALSLMQPPNHKNLRFKPSGSLMRYIGSL